MARPHPASITTSRWSRQAVRSEAGEQFVVVTDITLAQGTESAPALPGGRLPPGRPPGHFTLADLLKRYSDLEAESLYQHRIRGAEAVRMRLPWRSIPRRPTANLP
jgi:hypothetical protein